MKSGLITLLLLSSLHCYSQKLTESLKVRLDVPAVIEQRDQFILTVAFRNLYHKSVRVVNTPEFTDYAAEKGDIRFQVQQVDSAGRYRNIVIDSDFPPPLEHKIPMTDLAPGDSLFYRYDMGPVYSPLRGTYRVRVSVWYAVAGNWSHANSDWQHFQVRTDIFRRR